MSESAAERIFNMFDGHCHFCGDKIELNRHGYAAHMDGHWEKDHVVQKTKGGSDKRDNLAPACTRCNRLRWGRSGRSLRQVLFLGLVAKEAAFGYHESVIGPEVRARRIEQLGENWYKRMRAELTKKGLSDKKFNAEVELLKRRRRSYTRALTNFEDRVLTQLRARRGQKWNDVLTTLREKYQKAGTHRAWLSAERALGE
jgi:HNH endonuclease